LSPTAAVPRARGSSPPLPGPVAARIDRAHILLDGLGEDSDQAQADPQGEARRARHLSGGEGPLP
jgi:hypothetical protein